MPMKRWKKLRAFRHHSSTKRSGKPCSLFIPNMP
jgi:hypothetical protein